MHTAVAFSARRIPRSKEMVYSGPKHTAKLVSPCVMRRPNSGASSAQTELRAGRVINIHSLSVHWAPLKRTGRHFAMLQTTLKPCVSLLPTRNNAAGTRHAASLPSPPKEKTKSALPSTDFRDGSGVDIQAKRSISVGIHSGRLRRCAEMVT